MTLAISHLLMPAASNITRLPLLMPTAVFIYKLFSLTYKSILKTHYENYSQNYTILFELTYSISIDTDGSYIFGPARIMGWIF